MDNVNDIGAFGFSQYKSSEPRVLTAKKTHSGWSWAEQRYIEWVSERFCQKNKTRGMYLLKHTSILRFHLTGGELASDTFCLFFLHSCVPLGEKNTNK